MKRREKSSPDLPQIEGIAPHGDEDDPSRSDGGDPFAEEDEGDYQEKDRGKGEERQGETERGETKRPHVEDRGENLYTCFFPYISVT